MAAEKAREYEWPEDMPHCEHCEPRGNNPARPTWFWCLTRGKQIGPRIDCGKQCDGWTEAGTAASPPGPLSLADGAQDEGEKADGRGRRGGEPPPTDGNGGQAGLSAPPTTDGGDRDGRPTRADDGDGKGASAGRRCHKDSSASAGEDKTTGGAEMPQVKGVRWDDPAGETVDGAPMDQALWEWARDEVANGVTQTYAAAVVGCAPTSLMSAIGVREKQSGTPTKAGRRGMDWDGPPAGQISADDAETYQGALWEFCRDLHEGEFGSPMPWDEIGEEMGTTGRSVSQAVARRIKKAEADGGGNGGPTGMSGLRTAGKDGDDETPRSAENDSEADGSVAQASRLCVHDRDGHATGEADGDGRQLKFKHLQWVEEYLDATGQMEKALGFILAREIDVARGEAA